MALEQVRSVGAVLHLALRIGRGDGDQLGRSHGPPCVAMTEGEGVASLVYGRAGGIAGGVAVRGDDHAAIQRRGLYGARKPSGVESGPNLGPGRGPSCGRALETLGQDQGAPGHVVGARREAEGAGGLGGSGVELSRLPVAVGPIRPKRDALDGGAVAFGVPQDQHKGGGFGGDHAAHLGEGEEGPGPKKAKIGGGRGAQAARLQIAAGGLGGRIVQRHGGAGDLCGAALAFAPGLGFLPNGGRGLAGALGGGLFSGLPALLLLGGG